MNKQATEHEPLRSHVEAAFQAPQRFWKQLGRHLRTVLIAGLFTLIPLAVTLWVLGIVYTFLTAYFQRPATYLVAALIAYVSPQPLDPQLLAEWQRTVNNISSWVAPIFALVISLGVIYLLGVISRLYIGRRILDRFEQFFANLPLIKGIYGTTKQVIQMFRQGGGGQSFQRVVMVEFPRLGAWTIGFVTNTVTETTEQQRFVCVFIPMTPNPTSGFFQMFPPEQVRETDLTIDQGIKIVLSGGLLAPQQLAFGPPGNHAEGATHAGMDAAPQSPSATLHPPTTQRL